MGDTAELIARLRDEAGLKRDCNVCDGDGIKESGRPCGGCNQTGSVLVYGGRVGEMMTEAADALSSLVRERDELAERVDRMHGAEELLTAQNIIVRAVWDVLGGEDATRADGQNLVARVREITARATAAEADAARMRGALEQARDEVWHLGLVVGQIAKWPRAHFNRVYIEEWVIRTAKIFMGWGERSRADEILAVTSNQTKPNKRLEAARASLSNTSEGQK